VSRGDEAIASVPGAKEKEFDEYGNKSIERYRYRIGIQNEVKLVKMKENKTGKVKRK
jgi:hypothetical protein